ncbi:sulfurtransferase [Neobacillus niacini]|uniref:sulfurtransferase n=1 Tax=Neobacillus niacini TaxID=86668 RepID=UPI0021CB5668|nr:sulfurtransferase [Neobacillus niacini]MCM3766628.1 sulfurtransferase [Neobacillus niacini]
MKYVVDKQWLKTHLDDETVIIADCRFSLADSKKGQKEYLAGHLPGAVFFDLEKDLSSPVSEHGGRHPLPDHDEFITKLEAAGIDETKTVVAYDGGEGAFAARFWWLLHYLGHEKVFVLNGGFTQWTASGFPITTEVPSYQKTEFTISLKPDIVASVDEVKQAALRQREDVVLIDSREEKRYLGIEEPIDKKAGHIPGAVNKPWMLGLSAGEYRSVSEQKERFSDISLKQEIIVYCGSGVTATPNFLTLKEAGYKNVKLYPGSFSDWISYPENKVE